MTCVELADIIEPWAAGEIDPPAGTLAHMATCHACAAQLALAREIEAALAAPQAVSPRFTVNVLRAVRNDPCAMTPSPSRRSAWLGMALAALAAGGALMLVPVVNELIVRAWQPIGSALAPLLRALIVAPSGVYAGATGVIVMTVLLWEWIEGEA